MKIPMHDASHPYEQHLATYLLGELDAETRDAVEAHLDACAACRATLARLDAAFVASVEALPAPNPPPDTWAAIEARTRGSSSPRPMPSRARLPRWAVIGWALTVAIAIAVGSWGVQQRSVAFATAEALADLEARVAVLEAVASTVQARADGLASEQGRLVRWLARDDVRTRHLSLADDGVAHGSVLFLPDRRALVAVREAASEGESIVVLGEASDGSVTPLASTPTRTVEVDAAPYAALVVTRRGADDAAPTEIRLGRVEVPGGGR